MQRDNLKDKIATRIKRSRRVVFLRSDFKKLGGYDQVGRALRLLISEGKLIKLGYGLYGKARPNYFTGEPMLDSDYGFAQVAEQALKRLGVAWHRSEADKLEALQNYEEVSQQIPMRAEVVILDRFSRKIRTDNGFELLTVRA
jgi:hypothetical protein